MFKQSARRMVALAVQLGVIEKPKLCEFCREVGSLQAHHSDYRLPLFVAWLCVDCHRIVHTIERGGIVHWAIGGSKDIHPKILRARDRAIGRYLAYVRG